jgi:hypothetical protein
MEVPSFAAPAPYSIGNPTDEEQLYLELINRARANPAAEAQRLRNVTDPEILSAYTYFAVDLDLMVSQFATLSPAPPLSMNASLLAAARLHSQDMFTNKFQGHTGSNGSNPGGRISAQGFAWQTYGENVFASAQSVLHGHAGFEVDWGYGPGGMQSPPGHRQSIHNASFREVGVGLMNGVNGNVGPQLVTQDLATRFNGAPFVTGVVYHDHNRNGSYDVGEGLGGVRVDVSGASFYAITANSGGYSVPVPGNGAYQLSFSAANLVSTQRTVTVSGNANVKVDYMPPYAPPQLSGPAQAAIGQPNAYTFTPVGAAVGYQWKKNKRIPSTAVEGAENDLSQVTAQTSSGYQVVVNTVRASGSYSFHLAHPQTVDQVITLNRLFRPSAGSQLTFAGRLGWAAASQIARAQVSTNGGLAWQDVWSQAGTGTSGQAAFVRYTNALAAFAGQEVQVRFVYDYAGGSYYSQTSDGVGLYLDDVAVTQAEELVDQTVQDIPSGTSFAFTPTETTNYSLRVRAKVAERSLDWGPALLVRGAASGLVVRMKGPPVFSGNRALLNFEVVSGAASSFQIETALSPAGPWTVDTTATFQTLVAGSQYRASATLGNGRNCFYRVGAR